MAQQVDYRLMGSAVARVHWELNLNRRCQRDPAFYLEQTLTPVLETLLPPPPIDEQRSRELILRLQNISAILEEAKSTLSQPDAPFAKLAIESLNNIRSQLKAFSRDVAPMLSGNTEELGASVEEATRALESCRAWLQQRLPAMAQQTAVGREAYLLPEKRRAVSLLARAVSQAAVSSALVSVQPEWRHSHAISTPSDPASSQDCSQYF